MIVDLYFTTTDGRRFPCLPDAPMPTQGAAHYQDRHAFYHPRAELIQYGDGTWWWACRSCGAEQPDFQTLGDPRTEDG